MTAGESEHAPSMTNSEPLSPEAISTRIYKDLRRIALINRDFRERKIGSFSINVEQGDPLLPGDDEADSWEPGSEWPRERRVESYMFEGRRVQVGKSKQVLEFNYRYTEGLRNIRMPLHIAAYAYRGKTSEGIPVDPIEAAGPTTVEHTFEVEVNSDDRAHLSASESFAYYDHEGDQAVRTSSIIAPEDTEDLTVVPPMDILEDAEGIIVDRNRAGMADFDSIVDLRAPTAFFNDAATYLERTDDALSVEDVGMFALEHGYDVEMQDVLLAQRVLRGMKRAFRRQLGMRI